MARRASRTLVLAMGIVLGAGAASAATLPFNGTLEVDFFGLQPVSLTGSGVATVNGSGGGLHLSSLAIGAGAFMGAASTPVFNAAPLSGALLAGGTVTNMFTIGGMIPITLTYPTGSFSNAAGSFSGLSGGPPGGGVMPLNGFLFICLFAGGGGGGALGCGATVPSPAANIVIPLNVAGFGGTTARSGPVAVTVAGAPWTVGAASAFGSAVTGFVHGPGSGTSSAAQSSGVVSLVSAVAVTTNLGSLPVIPVLTRVTLHFVPEPATMLLLGAGVVALGLVGRRSSRGRR